MMLCRLAPGKNIFQWAQSMKGLGASSLGVTEQAFQTTVSSGWEPEGKITIAEKFV